MQPEENPVMRAISALPYEPTKDLGEIPCAKGLPIFGNTLAFIRRPQELQERLVKELGSVFQMSVFFRKTVVLNDPDAAELLLMDKQQNFSSSRGWLRLAPLFNRGILLRDFSAHRIHRRPLQAAFKSPVMREYGEQINSLVINDISKWPTAKKFHFQPAIKSLLLDNAASLFLGAELGEESDVLNKAFVDILGGVMALFSVDLPGFAWHRSMRGKKYLTQWLSERFEERLTSDKNDFFTSLCKASQDPEHAMSKQEVIEHTLLLLFAAHDTTTSTLSAIFSLLCEHPEWQEELRKECLSIDSNTLGFSDLALLPKCEWVFKEALRMYPAVFTIPRRAIHEFEFQGCRVPANASVMLQVFMIHHDPRFWTNPKKFDPERWSDERKEYKNHPYQYVPFGAGAHKCLGFRFAEMQSKIFMFNFLRNYRMSTKPGRKHDMVTLPIPLPRDRLPVVIEKL